MARLASRGEESSFPVVVPSRADEGAFHVRLASPAKLGSFFLPKLLSQAEKTSLSAAFPSPAEESTLECVIHVA